LRRLADLYTDEAELGGAFGTDETVSGVLVEFVGLALGIANTVTNRRSGAEFHASAIDLLIAFLANDAVPGIEVEGFSVALGVTAAVSLHAFGASRQAV